MGSHANDTLTIIALALGFAACAIAVRRTTNRGPIAKDAQGRRYEIGVYTTPEQEQVVIATPC